MNPVRNSSLNFLGSEKNMKQQNQKIFNPVINKFLSGASGGKNIILKTFKLINSRFVYLLVGIFLAVSITCVYAAWNDAKTGGSGELGQTNWNTLVNEIHSKCGTNCDAVATAATASSDILTENNWNNLVDLTSTTLTDCSDNNGGKCFINQASKSVLDTDLVAGNIISGKTIFGVAGTVTPQPQCDPSIQYYICAGSWDYQCFACTASPSACINWCRPQMGGAAFCSLWLANHCYCYANKTIQYGGSDTWATYCRN